MAAAGGAGGGASGYAPPVGAQKREYAPSSSSGSPLERYIDKCMLGTYVYIIEREREI